MTKCNPLLRFETSEYGESDSILFVGDDGYPGDDPIEFLYQKINAAHESRVEEEVKKAVEEFRVKCLDIVLGDRYGFASDEREAHHNADIEAVAEKIRALPTEPEAE